MRKRVVLNGTCGAASSGIDNGAPRRRLDCELQCRLRPEQNSTFDDPEQQKKKCRKNNRGFDRGSALARTAKRDEALPRLSRLLGRQIPRHATIPQLIRKVLLAVSVNVLAIPG